MNGFIPTGYLRYIDGVLHQHWERGRSSKWMPVEHYTTQTLPRVDTETVAEALGAEDTGIRVRSGPLPRPAGWTDQAPQT